MTPQPQWKIERIDIGMGDCEYLIQRNGVTICHTEDHSFALLVCSTMARDESRPTLSPAEQCNAESFWAIIEQNRAEAAAQARENVLDEIQDHNDGRLEGMDMLMATPSKERCESAQDVYLKEAYFELTLVKHLIESLRTEGGER